jgi:sec-independent protein translocase protein TatA
MIDKSGGGVVASFSVDRAPGPVYRVGNAETTALSGVDMLAFIGQTELIIIVLGILLLFGGRKIPELARGLGSGIREFQQGLKDKGGKKSLPDQDDDPDSPGERQDD